MVGAFGNGRRGASDEGLGDSLDFVGSLDGELGSLVTSGSPGGCAKGWTRSDSGSRSTGMIPHEVDCPTEFINCVSINATEGATSIFGDDVITRDGLSSDLVNEWLVLDHNATLPSASIVCRLYLQCCSSHSASIELVNGVLLTHRESTIGILRQDLLRWDGVTVLVNRIREVKLTTKRRAIRVDEPTFSIGGMSRKCRRRSGRRGLLQGSPG